MIAKVKFPKTYTIVNALYILDGLDSCEFDGIHSEFDNCGTL